MPLNSDQRAQMLQFFARDCGEKELREIRSHIDAELARRISRRLIELMPGNRIRFASELAKNGEVLRWDVGTLLRIHRRSLVVELLNRREVNVPGDRFMEQISEEEYQRLRQQQNLGPSAAEGQELVMGAQLGAAAPEHPLFQGTSTPEQFQQINLPSIGEIDERSVHLPDELI